MSVHVFETAATHRKTALHELREMANAAPLEDDEAFVRILGLCASVLELTDREIADALLVSRPTVNRWLRAESDPHPAMRRPIYAWIAKEVGRRLRAMDLAIRHEPSRRRAAGA